MLNIIKKLLESLEFVDNVYVIDHLISSKKAAIDVEMYGTKIRLYYFKRSWTKKHINFWKPMEEDWTLILTDYNVEKTDKLGKIIEMITLPSFKDYIEELKKNTN